MRTGGKTLPDEPNKYVRWLPRLCLPAAMPPYSFGSIMSGMVKKLEEGHGKEQRTDDFEEGFLKLKAWIDLGIPYVGSYDEANIWNQEYIDQYNKRMAERARNEEIERRHIKEFIKAGQGQ